MEGRKRGKMGAIESSNMPVLSDVRLGKQHFFLRSTYAIEPGRIEVEITIQLSCTTIMEPMRSNKYIKIKIQSGWTQKTRFNVSLIVPKT